MAPIWQVLGKRDPSQDVAVAAGAIREPGAIAAPLASTQIFTHSVACLPG